MNRADRYAQLIGSAPAGELAAMLGTISEAWDDAVDGQGTDHLSEAFRLALVELPKNSFYRANAEAVSTLLLFCQINWQIANSMESDADPLELEAAHVLRYLGASLVAYFAFAEGGMVRAVAAGREAWRMTTRESLADYIKEHAKC